VCRQGGPFPLRALDHRKSVEDEESSARSNVVLHYLILVGQLVKFCFRPVEESIIKLLLLGVKLQITKFIAAWEGQDVLAVWGLALFCPA
jgi:hypothetical protein